MRAASARPTPIDRPWPSAPVEASTPGTMPYSGWPPRMLSVPQKPSSSDSGKESAIGQQRIEREAAVALAQDRAVAVGIARVLRIDPQDVVVEHADDFDQRQRRADMAAPGGAHRAQHQPPQIEAALVELAGEGGFSVGRDLDHVRKSFDGAGEPCRAGRPEWRSRFATSSGHDTPGAAFRQIVVQDDQAPDHPEHRIQHVPTDRKYGILGFEFARKPLDQPLGAVLGKAAAGMDRGVGHELDRIVPAEIFEIDEAQLPGLVAQRVMQSEIRWTQGALAPARARLPDQGRAAHSAASTRSRARAALGARSRSMNLRKSGYRLRACSSNRCSRCSY